MYSFQLLRKNELLIEVSNKLKKLRKSDGKKMRRLKNRRSEDQKIRRLGYHGDSRSETNKVRKSDS